jgi:hypothetical protein
MCVSQILQREFNLIAQLHPLCVMGPLLPPPPFPWELATPCVSTETNDFPQAPSFDESDCAPRTDRNVGPVWFASDSTYIQGRGLCHIEKVMVKGLADPLRARRAVERRLWSPGDPKFYLFVVFGVKGNHCRWSQPGFSNVRQTGAKRRHRD